MDTLCKINAKVLLERLQLLDLIISNVQVTLIGGRHDIDSFPKAEECMRTK